MSIPVQVSEIVAIHYVKYMAGVVDGSVMTEWCECVCVCVCASASLQWCLARRAGYCRLLAVLQSTVHCLQSTLEVNS